MNKLDYRNTEYCDVLKDVEKQKQLLQSEIHSLHPRLSNYYRKINKRGTNFNRKFRDIYNRKCAYCGASVSIIPNKNFEIDHYKCKSGCNKDEKINELANLVYSCHDCNYRKRALEIPQKYDKLLNPDNSSINNVFYRDEFYNIKIKKEYENDYFVNQFYRELHFDYDDKRLDYLLMNVIGLSQKLQGSDDSVVLEAIASKLLMKRNLFE